MPDYSLENINNPYVSTLISGMLGVCLVLAVSFIIGKAVSKGEQIDLFGIYIFES